MNQLTIAVCAAAVLTTPLVLADKPNNEGSGGQFLSSSAQGAKSRGGSLGASIKNAIEDSSAREFRLGDEVSEENLRVNRNR